MIPYNGFGNRNDLCNFDHNNFKIIMVMHRGKMKNKISLYRNIFFLIWHREARWEARWNDYPTRREMVRR